MVCREPAGVSARQPTYFSLLRQKEVGKRKATPMPAPLGCAKGFPVLLRTWGRRGTRCVRCAHSAQTAAPRMIGSALRAPPKSLRCSAWHRGPRTVQQPSSQQPNSEQPAPPRLARRFPAVGCSAAWGPLVAAEKRRRLGPGRAAPDQLLDRRGRSSGESEANVMRSAPPAPGSEHRKGSRPQGGTRKWARVLCLLSCTSKKVGRLPGRHPGGLYRSALQQLKAHRI